MEQKRTFSEFLDICERVTSDDVSLARSGRLSSYANDIQQNITDVLSGKTKTLGGENSGNNNTRKGPRRKIQFIDRSNSTHQGNTK